MNISSPRGYIAVVSALIISTLLTVLVFATGTDAFLARYDVLDYENHLQARHFALSCLYAGLFSISVDPSYHVSSAGISITTEYPAHSCRITNVSISRTEATITATAIVRATQATLVGIIDLNHHQLVSWKEMNGI
jgi:hypothetical protein